MCVGVCVGVCVCVCVGVLVFHWGKKKKKVRSLLVLAPLRWA